MKVNLSLETWIFQRKKKWEKIFFWSIIRHNIKMTLYWITDYTNTKDPTKSFPSWWKGENKLSTFPCSLALHYSSRCLLASPRCRRRRGEIEILLGVCRIKQQSVTIIAEQPFGAMPSIGAFVIIFQISGTHSSISIPI